MALNYTKYLSVRDPEREFLKAKVYSKIHKKTEAYKIYEELLMEETSFVQKTLDCLHKMYLEDNNHAMALELANLLQ